MKTKYEFLRCFSVLMVMALGTVGAMAESYLSDIMIVSNHDSAPSGYTKIDVDLNHNAGGNYVYLYCKYSDNPADAIRDIYIVQEPHGSRNYAGEQNRTLNLNGKTYHAAPYATNADGGNLNNGTGGNSLWLYYTKDCTMNYVNTTGSCKFDVITKLKLYEEDDLADFYNLGYSAGFTKSYDVETGIISRLLANCNEGNEGSKYIAIQKIGGERRLASHNAMKVEAKEATATEDGNIEHWQCLTCKRVYADADCINELSRYGVIIPKEGETIVQPGYGDFGEVALVSEFLIQTDEDKSPSGYYDFLYTGTWGDYKYVNLSSGTNGKEVHLFYTTTNNLDEAIKDIIIVSEPHGSYEYSCDKNRTITIGHRTYHPASFSKTSDGGNLNVGVSNGRSRNLWLYYTKDEEMYVNNAGMCQVTALRGLDIKIDNNSGDFRAKTYVDDYVQKYDAMTGQLTKETADCNEDAGGDWVSLWKYRRSVAQSHWFEKREHVSPTCTEAGNIEHYSCSRCHRAYEDSNGWHDLTRTDISIPATGHNKIWQEYTMPTCTTDGHADYYRCENCEKLYSYYFDTTREINYSEVRFPATGHKWEFEHDEENDAYNLVCQNDATHTQVRKQLCLHSAEDDAVVSVENFGTGRPVVQYSLNAGEWTDLQTSVTIGKTDLLWLRGLNPDGFSTEKSYTTISATKEISATGSVMSLIDNEGEATEIPDEYCFNRLFASCHNLSKAPSLPATTLKKGCYAQMFAGTLIKEAPELPATTLVESCYENMFGDCYLLVKPSELPATTLAKSCYASMYDGTNIRVAPELPATTLADRCYENMFNSCAMLTSVKLGATEINANNCFSNWLDGTAALGRLKNGVVNITDELALANANLPLPANWRTDKVVVSANQNPQHTGDYYATFYDSQTEYSVKEGTTAYTGTVEGNVLKMNAEDDNIIPANEGVLLKGNTANVILTLSDTKKLQTESNILIGSDYDTYAPTNCYVFTYGQNGSGFYQYAAGNPLGAHSAYLVSDSGAKGFPLSFYDIATGADPTPTLPSREGENVAIYNLQGVRLNNLRKGVNIVGGKKVIIK